MQLPVTFDQGRGTDRDLLVSQIGSTGVSEAGSVGVSRLLWAARWKLGASLGWDGEDSGLGARVASVRDRLPEDLRCVEPGPVLAALPFTFIYELEDEWAAEIANATMHGILHLGWVEDTSTGGYRGQMAVLIKPNGLPGRLYMAAIRPFRRLIVYPALMKQVERKWKTLNSETAKTRGDVASVVGWNNVSEALHALVPSWSTSYVDVFTLRTDVKALPTEWASAIMEDAAGFGGQGIWRGLLGLRLDHSGAPDTVAGWAIADHSDGWIRFEARSWCLTCQLVVRTEEDCVSLATFVDYSRPAGHLLWIPVSAAHRRLVPGLLRRGAAILRRHDEQASSGL